MRRQELQRKRLRGLQRQQRLRDAGRSRVGAAIAGVLDVTVSDVDVGTLTDGESRAQIRGDTTGRLKLIFNRETREILGVHIIGEGASELLHIGQAVMALGGTINYFADTVFNYPTLAEAYKTAAFNGINKVSQYD